MSDWFDVLTLSVFIHTSATCALFGRQLCCRVWFTLTLSHVQTHTQCFVVQLFDCVSTQYLLSESELMMLMMEWAEQRKRRRSCCVHFGFPEASDNERKSRESHVKASAASLEEKVRDLIPLEKQIDLALRLNWPDLYHAAVIDSRSVHDYLWFKKIKS